jgi:hypothetical protein
MLVESLGWLLESEHRRISMSAVAPSQTVTEEELGLCSSAVWSFISAERSKATLVTHS